MYFLFLMVFLMTFFPSLAYCIVRIQHIIRPIYKICVDQLFMLSVKLLSTLGYYKFLGGVKSYMQSSTAWERGLVSSPPHCSSVNCKGNRLSKSSFGSPRIPLIFKSNRKKTSSQSLISFISSDL